MIRNREVYDQIGQSPAPAPATRYDAIAKTAVNSAFNKVSTDQLDVNTSFRQAEEDINKQIEASRKSNVMLYIHLNLNSKREVEKQCPIGANGLYRS